MWAIAEPRIGIYCINTMVDLVIMCGIQPGGCGRQNDAEIVQIGMGNVRRAGTLVALPWPNLNCAAIYFCCVLEKPARHHIYFPHVHKRRLHSFLALQEHQCFYST